MPMEKEKFKTLAQAHGYLLDKIWQRIHQINPYAKLYFVSHYYNYFRHLRKENDKKEKYLQDTRLWNKNIIFTWTGPTTCSYKITQDDIDNWRGFIGYDRKLVLWDNSYLLRCPLNGYSVEFPEHFENYCDIVYFEVRTAANDPHSILPGRLSCVTGTDYFWSPRLFDEVKARKTAIAQFFGKDAVPFAERYYKIRKNDYYKKFAKTVDFNEYRKILEGIGISCGITYEDVAGIELNISGVSKSIEELWKNEDMSKLELQTLSGVTRSMVELWTDYEWSKIQQQEP